MNYPTGKLRARLAAAVAATLLGHASQAIALSFEFGDGKWTMDLDTIVSYSAQWRVEKQDRDKFGYKNTGNLLDDLTRYTIMVNAEDGNFNFDRGIVKNKISVVTEMDLNGGDYGFFARARASYDEVYDSRTDHSEEDFLSYNSGKVFGGDASFRTFPEDTVDEHRDRLEMLDYFAYLSGELPGDRLFDLRAGSQVINWGEATFYQGINGLQNHIDVIASNTPGVEVKEILLPTGAIYGQVDITPSMTFEAYYQYEWNETELNGVGSYFSDRDFLGPSAKNFLVALGPGNFVAAPLLGIEDASDSGQWGSAIHYVTDGGTDFGVYYVNAHNKAPAYQLVYDGQFPAGYYIQYFEDIEGYAGSFTTILGNANIQGELSYKDGVPVVLDSGDPTEGELWSAQIGGSLVMEPTDLWDDANLTFELATTLIDSHSGRELRYDDRASAIALRYEMVYLNVRPGLDIKVPLFVMHTISGSVLEANMIENATVASVVVKGVYLNNFSAEIGYNAYFDGGDDHLLTDRDNVSFSVSYSF